MDLSGKSSQKKDERGPGPCGLPTQRRGTPDASSRWLLLPLISSVLRSILVAPFEFEEETAFRGAFGMSYDSQNKKDTKKKKRVRLRKTLLSFLKAEIDRKDQH